MGESELADVLDYHRRRSELPAGLTYRDELTAYFDWQAGLFRSVLRGTVIDHGSGTGSLANAVVKLDSVDKVVALEPDPELVGILHERFDDHAKVEVYAGTLDDYRAEHPDAAVDCIVSSNVIEHIRNDEACIALARDLLKPGGALGLYVPARPELYGSLDTAVGHERRYTRSDLRSKLTRVGFRIDTLEYRNMIAVVPWLVAGKVMKKQALHGSSLRIFDRFVLPVMAAIENAVAMPYGLNILGIATKE